jgi:hypothetical protein
MVAARRLESPPFRAGSVKTAEVHCQVSDGLTPNEKVARVQTADGKSEEVAVSAQNIQNDKLLAFVIGRDEGNVLVELPRESASGRWRIWVKEAAIGG